jgi:DNA/RNA endonuclease YhcR with UshA esterase domain
MNLLKVSLIISILGIFILLLISNFLGPKQKTISEINPSLTDQTVRIQGIILSIRNMENKSFQILSINDSAGKIDITLNSITRLKKGEKIQVTGKVTEYKKNLEIQADKIILLK